MTTSIILVALGAILLNIVMVVIERKTTKPSFGKEWTFDEGVSFGDEVRAVELLERYGKKEIISLPATFVLPKSVRDVVEQYSTLEFDDYTMDYTRKDLLNGEETQECWKGFYSFLPESYLALMRTHFTDIDYAMKNVIEEDKILKNSSRILTAIKQVISEDETLKAICKREIVASDIHWCRSAGNNTCWDISINAFTCTKGKTCILKIKDGIKSLNVSYEIIDANNVKNIYESKSVCVII